MPTVSGIVKNSEGIPVENTLISLNPFWTTSGPDGSYSLEVPVGSYTLKIVHKDYREKSVPLTVNKPITLDIELTS